MQLTGQLGAARVERVTLAGLGEREAQTLLETSAGRRSRRARHRAGRELHRETAGNPFFLGEMVRHLAESGAIQRRGDGVWTEATVLSTLELPASVHEVISGRVARLGPDAERVLRTAAVIGREFDVHLLARVSGIGEDDAIDILEAAAAAVLVAEAGDRPGRFTFVHALVNHALGDELTGARRARLHERIAEALEGRRADDPEPSLGELAQHWAAVAEPGAQAKARLRHPRRPGRAVATRPRRGGPLVRAGARAGCPPPRDRCGQSARASARARRSSAAGRHPPVPRDRSTRRPRRQGGRRRRPTRARRPGQQPRVLQLGGIRRCRAGGGARGRARACGAG